MHIPDGYISPATAVALYGAAAPFWWVAVRKIKGMLTGQTVPLIAIFSAFTFTIMMFNIPVPGGTTAHAVGGTLAAVVAGPWAAIIAVSVALIIQALFFGDGGITAIGANCFNLAIALPLTGYAVYSLIARGSDPLSRRRLIAAVVGGYVGVNVAALLTGIQLGIQPIFWSEDGRALYSPYSLGTSVGAMMAVHLTVAGLAEALATGAAVAYIQRVHPQLLAPRGAVASAARRGSAARVTAIVALVVMLLVPLGLLASGTAWGEWGSDELREKVGYVPSGFERLESTWSAPFPDYTMPWIAEDAPFAQQALAYVLSAIIGLGLIVAAVFSLRIIGRRWAGQGAPSGP